MKKFLLGLSFSLLTSTAFAADAIVDEVDVAPIFVWTGGYVGLQAGYLWGDSTADYSDTGGPGFTSPIDPDGWFGGVYAGYNYQFSNALVLGVEADISYADVDGSSPLLFPDGSPVPDQSFSGEIDWVGSVRARVGYAIDRFLPFVTGGVSFAHYDVGNTVFGTTEHALDETLTGWTIGGGVEYAFTDNLLGKIEYRYADYGNERAGAVLFDDYDVDLETHDVRLGIAYKF